MYHHRLANEFLLRLGRRALQVIAPCLRPEEQEEALSEFIDGFRQDLLRYEQARERMQARLAGRSEVRIQLTDEGEATQSPTTGQEYPAGGDDAAG